MILSDQEYSAIAACYTQKVEGVLTCPICNRYIQHPKEILYGFPTVLSREVLVDAYTPARTRTLCWVMADDLTILCSDECLQLHNLLGGIYANVGPLDSDHN